jgi:UDP-N-acetylglucosamine diphosphorylase/glucosamine-1-phosphate N-acetyltransferase
VNNPNPQAPDPQETAAVILAAGKGTRMKADMAKVLFPLGGRPLLLHVLDAVEAAQFDRTVVVVGHQGDQVQAAAAGRTAGTTVEFVLQEPQLGTGHAVQCAAPLLGEFPGSVAVLAGDAPLIRSSTLQEMMTLHRETGAMVTILTARVPDPTGYGRIIRDHEGRITGIVEDKDCLPEQRPIDEINSSIYAFNYPFLSEHLFRLGNDNRQKEYYLTDIVSMAFEKGERVEGIIVADHREISGINTREQLEDAETVHRERDQDQDQGKS